MLITHSMFQAVARKRATTLWTPANITTVGWWDAADPSTITESGGSVSQWDDKSGNSNHLTQGAGSAQPTTGTRTHGGLNVLDFDGGDYMTNLSSSLHVASGDINVFMFAAVDALTNPDQSLWSIGSTGSAPYQFRSTKTDFFRGQVDLNSAVETDVTWADSAHNGPSIYNIVADYTGVGDINTYLDDTFMGNSGAYNAPLDQGLQVMKNRAGTPRAINGFCAEVIYTADCTTETRQKVEGYIAWKWGQEANLPSGHPYENNPPYA